MDTDLVLLISGALLFAVISARWPVLGLGLVLMGMQLGQFMKPEIAGRTLLLSLSDIGVGLLLITVVIPHVLVRGLPFRRTPLLRSWLIYGALLIPSVFAATDILRWLAGARILAQDLIVFAACLVALRKTQQVRRLAITVVAWGCLTVLVLCANVFGGAATYMSVLASKETDVLFARSNYLAAILLLIVPLCLHLYRGAVGGWYQLVLLFANVTLIGGVVLTKSRGGALVLAGYLLIFLFKVETRIIRKLAVAVMVLAAAWVAATAIPGLRDQTLGTIPALPDVASDREVVTRRFLWEQNFSAFVERPIIGNGLLNTLVERSTSGSQHPFMEAHNYILQVLAETGTLGFVGFACLWVTVIRTLSRGRRDLDKDDWRYSLLTGALGSTGTAFAHGLIENNLLTKEFGIVQWMVIGIAVAAVGLRRGNDRLAFRIPVPEPDAVYGGPLAHARQS